MINNNDFLMENIQSTRDARQTGAIPRHSESDSYLPPNYKQTIEKINLGQRVCVILRGLPGSGKSHLAKKIIADTIQGNGDDHIISTDNYFKRGSRYEYDVTKLSLAHDTTQKLFANSASKGYSPLIVDNTNMKYWEFFYYLQGAVQYGYAIEIMEPNTVWRWNVPILAKKNSHGVPLEKIKSMKGNYETGCSLEKILNSLGLQAVTEPKMRLIPPYNLVDAINDKENAFAQNLIDFSINDNDQKKTQDKNANFNDKKETTPFFWTPPPQIFEDKWEQPPILKNKVVKEKEQKIENPLPQRKQSSKGKKPPDLELMPHRKNCPNENEQFTQLRELFPDVTDSYIWDLFVNCKGNSNWTADLLYADDKVNEMQKGEELSCDCGSISSSGSSTSMETAAVTQNNQKPILNNSRKQTPTRAKKVKTQADSDALATKAAIEASIQIRPEFYPDHVRAVKSWKQPLLPTPTGISVIENSSPPPPTLVALSIDEKLILELDDKFGDGLLKFALDRDKNFPEKIFVNEKTARELYEQIMDTYHSKEAENQLESVKNDRILAQSLFENEKAVKYPKLFVEPNGNFKKIMENEEALKQYENDMNLNGYQKENETLAQVIKKQRLYKAFPDVPQLEINNLFEVLAFDFNETVKMLQENLGYSKEQCKEVQEKLAKDSVWRSDSSSDESENFGEEIDMNTNTGEYGTLKVVEDLREEISHHMESHRRCNDISNEKKSKKDFQTANYYTDMAALHKQMAAEKKLEVASMIAGLHAQDQESSNMLDLHYHNIVEATTILHTFLDKNISRLREIRKPFAELFIITGRGAHSKNGVATIKNMTIQQLKERLLRQENY